MRPNDKKQYIKNLVSNLIGKNHYLEVWKKTIGKNHFIQFVKTDLETGDVREMRPEKLGQIMCSFNQWQVVTSHPGKEVAFGGNVEGMFRELVALCLAYAIYNRINKDEYERYTHKRLYVLAEKVMTYLRKNIKFNSDEDISDTRKTEPDEQTVEIYFNAGDGNAFTILSITIDDGRILKVFPAFFEKTGIIDEQMADDFARMRSDAQDTN